MELTFKPVERHASRVRVQSAQVGLRGLRIDAPGAPTHGIVVPHERSWPDQRTHCVGFVDEGGLSPSLDGRPLLLRPTSRRARSAAGRLRERALDRAWRDGSLRIVEPALITGRGTLVATAVVVGVALALAVAGAALVAPDVYGWWRDVGALPASLGWAVRSVGLLIAAMVMGSGIVAGGMAVALIVRRGPAPASATFTSEGVGVTLADGSVGQWRWSELSRAPEREPAFEKASWRLTFKDGRAVRLRGLRVADALLDVVAESMNHDKLARDLRWLAPGRVVLAACRNALLGALAGAGAWGLFLWIVTRLPIASIEDHGVRSRVPGMLVGAAVLFGLWASWPYAFVWLCRRSAAAALQRKITRLRRLGPGPLEQFASTGAESSAQPAMAVTLTRV